MQLIDIVQADAAHIFPLRIGAQGDDEGHIPVGLPVKLWSRVLPDPRRFPPIARTPPAVYATPATREFRSRSDERSVPPQVSNRSRAQ